MIGAMAPFITDPEFVEMGTELNLLAGVRMPKETWKHVTDTLNRAPPAPLEPVAKSHPSGGARKGTGVPQVVAGSARGFSLMGPQSGPRTRGAVAPAPGPPGSNGVRSQK